MEPSSTNKCQTGSNFPFSEVWTRIKSTTELSNYNELASIIGVSQPTISRLKKIDSFPVEWAFLVASKYGLLTEWVLKGEGPKRLSEHKNETLLLSKKDDKLNDKFKTLEKWVSRLSGGNLEHSDWFWMQLDAAFPMFKEWRLEKEEKGRTDDIVRSKQKIA